MTFTPQPIIVFYGFSGGGAISWSTSSISPAVSEGINVVVEVETVVFARLPKHCNQFRGIFFRSGSILLGCMTSSTMLQNWTDRTISSSRSCDRFCSSLPRLHSSTGRPKVNPVWVSSCSSFADFVNSSRSSSFSGWEWQYSSLSMSHVVLTGKPSPPRVAPKYVTFCNTECRISAAVDPLLSWTTSGQNFSQLTLMLVGLISYNVFWIFWRYVAIVYCHQYMPSTWNRCHLGQHQWKQLSSPEHSSCILLWMPW